MTNKQKRIGMIIGWIALGISLLVVLRVVILIDDWGRDLNQNYAELHAESEDRLLRPVTVGLTPAKVAQQITDWVDSDSHWKRIDTDVGDDRVAMHLTRTTTLMRYVDDLHVQIAATDGGSRITASSKSRIGIGDLGQNPRNLRELTGLLLLLRTEGQ